MGNIPQEAICFWHYFLNYQGKLEASYDVYTKYKQSPIPTGGLDVPVLLIVRIEKLMRETLRYLTTSGYFSFKSILHFVRIFKVILEFVYFCHVFN